MHACADSAVHVSTPLADADPEVCAALDDEARRQHARIELIASENVMIRTVREALGHEIGNKRLEGYPGNRFHGGGEHVDAVERLAIGIVGGGTDSHMVLLDLASVGLLKSGGTVSLAQDVRLLPHAPLVGVCVSSHSITQPRPRPSARFRVGTVRAQDRGPPHEPAGHSAPPAVVPSLRVGRHGLNRAGCTGA